MTMKTFFAIFAAAVLCLAAVSRADQDWRRSIRAELNPSGDIESVLASRGVVLDDTIGGVSVDLTYSSGLALSVDGSPVNDLSQWIENDGSKVIAFGAYVGEGVLGPNADMGLRGWVYLDDFGNVRVDMIVGLENAIYEVTVTGAISQARHPACRCDTINHPQGGCEQFHCTNEASCPTITGPKCGYVNIPTAFPASFEALVQ